MEGGGQRLIGVAFPVGQTLGQTASFRQTAPETWCQSRVCGVCAIFIQVSPRLVVVLLLLVLLPCWPQQHPETDADHIRQLIANYAAAVDAADVKLAGQIWDNSPEVSFFLAAEVTVTGGRGDARSGPGRPHVLPVPA